MWINCRGLINIHSKNWIWIFTNILEIELNFGSFWLIITYVIFILNYQKNTFLGLVGMIFWYQRAVQIPPCTSKFRENFFMKKFFCWLVFLNIQNTFKKYVTKILKDLEIKLFLYFTSKMVFYPLVDFFKEVSWESSLMRSENTYFLNDCTIFLDSIY